MAHAKSAKKRIKTNEARRKRNVARRSEIKTITKKMLDTLSLKNFDEARVLLCSLQSKISRAQGKGIFKSNTASRKISKLAKVLTKAAQSA